MRNLVISSATTWILTGSTSADQPSISSPTSITFDLDERSLYCALERSGSASSDGSRDMTSHVSFVKIQAGSDPVSYSMIDDEALIEFSCHSMTTPLL